MTEALTQEFLEFCRRNLLPTHDGYKVLCAFVREVERRIDVVRQSKTGIYTIDRRGIFEQLVRDFGLEDKP